VEGKGGKKARNVEIKKKKKKKKKKKEEEEEEERKKEKEKEKKGWIYESAMLHIELHYSCSVVLFTYLRKMYSNFCLHNPIECVFNLLFNYFSLKLQIANPLEGSLHSKNWGVITFSPMNYRPVSFCPHELPLRPKESIKLPFLHTLLHSVSLIHAKT
jgi:hypothetical protein